MTDYHLSHLSLCGFRSIEALTLDLQPGVNVVIGPNGAGKSNLLEALRMVVNSESGHLRPFVEDRGGASALLFRGAKVTPFMSVLLAWSDGNNCDEFYVEYHHVSGDRLSPRNTRHSSYQGPPRRERHTPSSFEPIDKTSHTLHDRLRRIGYFHFHDTSARASIRNLSRKSDAKYLRSDGSNIAAYLLQLKMGSDDERRAFKRILRTIQQIAPFIHDLTPETVGNQENGESVRLDWLDQNGNTYEVHQLSDGTIRAIALITAMAQPRNKVPDLISIDEPELGLHPAALTLIAELIDSVATDRQVILATQSPLFLDFFPVEALLIAELQDGRSTFKKLNPADLAAWSAEYSMAELYDKNVLGGRP